jgi:hypothetical protein
MKNGVTAIAGGNYSITVDDSWLYAEFPNGKILIGAEVEFEPEEEAPEASRTPTIDVASALGSSNPEPEEPEESTLTMNPCYEVYRQMTPQGLQINVVPYGLFLAPVNVTLMSQPFAIVRVGDLDEKDRKGLVDMVKAGEKLRLEMRAQASGLALAGGRAP